MSASNAPAPAERSPHTTFLWRFHETHSCIFDSVRIHAFPLPGRLSRPNCASRFPAEICGHARAGEKTRRADSPSCSGKSPCLGQRRRRRGQRGHDRRQRRHRHHRHRSEHRMRGRHAEKIPGNRPGGQISHKGRRLYARPRRPHRRLLRLLLGRRKARSLGPGQLRFRTRSLPGRWAHAAVHHAGSHAGRFSASSGKTHQQRHRSRALPLHRRSLIQRQDRGRAARPFSQGRQHDDTRSRPGALAFRHARRNRRRAQRVVSGRKGALLRRQSLPLLPQSLPRAGRGQPRRAGLDRQSEPHACA